MRKKHFVEVAKILKKATEYHYQNDKVKTKIARDMLEVIIYDFDDYFQSIAPKFDSEKFLTACNIKELRGY